MLRLITSLALLLTIPAFLFPATGRAQEDARSSGPCFDFSSEATREMLDDAEVVVLGLVAEVIAGERALVEPEAYLKGATTPEQLVLPHPDAMMAEDYDCEPATLAEGERMLLVLGRDAGRVAWPGDGQAYLLAGGEAIQIGGIEETLAEEDLVDRIRNETGQYSIPAQSDDERARLDWFGTVVPVTAVIVVVLGIGLVLMREWHRIDPS